MYVHVALYGYQINVLSGVEYALSGVSSDLGKDVECDRNLKVTPLTAYMYMYMSCISCTPVCTHSCTYM